jgi:hypothetical protein
MRTAGTCRDRCLRRAVEDPHGVEEKNAQVGVPE